MQEYTVVLHPVVARASCSRLRDNHKPDICSPTLFKTVGRWPGSERPTSQLTLFVISVCTRSQSREVRFSVLEVLLLLGSHLEWLRLFFIHIFSACELLVLRISLFLRHSAFRTLAFLTLECSTTSTAASVSTVRLSVSTSVSALAAATTGSSARALSLFSLHGSIFFHAGV
jgi:hypothetical protein